MLVYVYFKLIMILIFELNFIIWVIVSFALCFLRGEGDSTEKKFYYNIEYR